MRVSRKRTRRYDPAGEVVWQVEVRFANGGRTLALYILGIVVFAGPHRVRTP
jgi:hypothetical protein